MAGRVVCCLSCRGTVPELFEGPLGINHAHRCVSKSEGYGSQVIEMDERMSNKMGVKFAVALPMGRFIRNIESNLRQKFLMMLFIDQLF